MLENVLEEDREMVRRTFVWLAFSARPVTVDQLMEAVLVEPVQPYFELEARFDDEEAFLSMFPAGLIRTLENDGSDSDSNWDSAIDDDSSTSETTSVSTTLEDGDSDSSLGSVLSSNKEFSRSKTTFAAAEKPTVQFAHFSVQEFLISNRMKVASYKLEEQSGHALISESCLSYVLFVDGENLKISEALAEDFPLLFYACKCWHYHRRNLSDKASSPALEDLLQRWLKSRSALKIWLDFGLKRAFRLRGEVPTYSFLEELDHSDTALGWDFARDSDYIYVEYDYQRPSWGFDRALAWLAFLGMGREIEALHKIDSNVGSGTDQNDKGHFKEPLGNILHAASLGGRLTVMEQLLNWELDINMVGGYYGTALQAAAALGNIAMVELLLKMGADHKIVSGYYGTALQAAAAKGHQTVVDLLLERGSDVNIVGGRYGTALQAAAMRGHQTVVDLLLVHGSDPNIVSGYHGTAVQAAAYGGDVGILESLHQHGADINLVGGVYGSVPGAAVYSLSFQEVFAFLLKHKYDFTIGSPLHEAALRGRVAAMKFLLDQGCGIDSLNEGGWTPLHRAAIIGNAESIAWFLKNGCNIHAISRNGKTALQLAVEAPIGSLTAFELLLEAGASVDPVAGEQGSSILTTIDLPGYRLNYDYYGVLIILKSLLNKGAGLEHIQLALEQARLRAAQTGRSKKTTRKFCIKAISMLKEAEQDHIYQGISLLYT